METLGQNNLVLVLIMLWTLPWKAYALWIASKKNQKRWFIALVLLNTFALLDIFYIFFIAKKTPNDLLKAFKTKL